MNIRYKDRGVILEKIVLNNRIILIYTHRPGELTSFCIGFNAGALEENKRFSLGTAHAVEHMISKGSKKRNEKEINRLCDSIFGFENAMTNFSYAIYYGTSLSSNFENAFEVYSDMLMNPVFPRKGFYEEMNVILQELKEWRENTYQYCEDRALYNAFSKKRIKFPIIGSKNSVSSISLDEIKDFYDEYYSPHNCVISVCSSLKLEEIFCIVDKYMGNWKKNFSGLDMDICEKNTSNIIVEKMALLEGAKIQYIFSIDKLNIEEFKNLMLFNTAFGDGLSSILFDEIRTNYGLAYDVTSRINYDRGVKFFTITMGTSKENVEKVLNLTNLKIDQVRNDYSFFNVDKINYLNNRIKIKKQLRLERAIQLCKDLTCAELMYNSAEFVYDEVKDLNKISSKGIIDTINKILDNPFIQIIK